jgi:hypothetical protein
MPAFIQRNRFIERCFAAFKFVNYVFECFQSVFEIECLIGVVGWLGHDDQQWRGQRRGSSISVCVIDSFCGRAAQRTKRRLDETGRYHQKTAPDFTLLFTRIAAKIGLL